MISMNLVRKMESNDREHMYQRFRRNGNPPNIVNLLQNRQMGLGKKFTTQFEKFADWKAAVSGVEETRCDLYIPVREITLMAFSPDCNVIAVSHSNLYIFVFDAITGKHKTCLEGHRSPPQSLAFHPVSNDILASGCRVGEVRIWNLRGTNLLWGTVYPYPITSLAFHPTSQLLAACSANKIYYWNWDYPTPRKCSVTKNEHEKVQYVKFDRFGGRIIVGILNRDRSPSASRTKSFVCSSTSFRLHKSKLNRNYRIQVWNFSPNKVPNIKNATENLVVRSCVIDTDGSVDISRDGEMVVVLLPRYCEYPVRNFTFGIFSLRPEHLGRTLCTCAFVSNALSVGFSPHCDYLVVGLEFSKPELSDCGKAHAAHIIKLDKKGDLYDASLVRSLTLLARDDRFPLHLNFVKWLPISGLGFAYATQRANFSICKPRSGEFFDEDEEVKTICRVRSE